MGLTLAAQWQQSCVSRRVGAEAALAGVRDLVADFSG